MEGEGIGLVLARATELRLKINNCIQKASANANGNANDEPKNPDVDDDEDDNDDDDDETARLLHISDALEALETQLSSLQALQQQQQYEREAALADIENSRKMLIDKLKEYKGKDLDVLHETSAFAGETVEHKNDLLLPPYPSRPPNSMVLDKGYMSHIPSMYKPVRNGSINNLADEGKNEFAQSEKNQTQSSPKESRKVFRHFIGETIKTALTFVGLVSILSMTGIGPKFAKRDAPSNILGLFQHSAVKENRSDQCPSGKVLVVENGEARCVVRERVEIPFESVVTKPDVNYGCG